MLNFQFYCSTFLKLEKDKYLRRGKSGLSYFLCYLFNLYFNRKVYVVIFSHLMFNSLWANKVSFNCPRSNDCYESGGVFGIIFVYSMHLVTTSACKLQSRVFHCMRVSFRIKNSVSWMKLPLHCATIQSWCKWFICSNLIISLFLYIMHIAYYNAMQQGAACG